MCDSSLISNLMKYSANIIKYPFLNKKKAAMLIIFHTSPWSAMYLLYGICKKMFYSLVSFLA